MVLIDVIDIESNLYNATGGLERLYCEPEHFSAVVQHRWAAVYACNHLKTVHATVPAPSSLRRGYVTLTAVNRLYFAHLW